MENEIRYSYKNIDQPQLESQLDEFWQGLQQYLDLAAEARAQGIELEELRGKPRKMSSPLRRRARDSTPLRPLWWWPFRR